MSLADITSANVVGYSQVTVPAQQYTMIGIQFSAVDGQDIDIQDLFADPLGQGLTGAGTPNSAAAADQLMYWDPEESGKYVMLYLNNNQAQSARYNKWCTETSIPKDSTWGTAKNQASPKKLKSGMGLWLVRAKYDQPITLNMAGGVVVAQEGRTYTVHEGYNMISGGFTTGFAPNPDVAGVGEAIDWLGLGLIGAGTPNSAAGADQLMFWDPNESGKYVMLYLNNNKSQTARYNKWCTETTIPKDTTWGTSKNQASPKVMPMGRGVWLVRPSGAGNLTFTLPQPYTLQ